VAHRFAVTINGLKLFIQPPTAPPAHHTITIITLHNTINSPATASLAMEILSDTTLVAAPCHPHTAAYKKAYLLPSKRPP
jgi:hypothetical protein